MPSKKQRRRREIGQLSDIVVGPDGTLQELVVAADGLEARVAFDESVRIVLASRSAA